MGIEHPLYPVEQLIINKRLVPAGIPDALVVDLAYSFGGGPDGEPAYVLFGFAPGTKGMNLTERRERCGRYTLTTGASTWN